MKTYKIKQLKWVVYDNGLAARIFGEKYYICFVGAGYIGDTSKIKLTINGITTVHNSIDEAKYAAQKHFEERIKKVLNEVN